MRSLILVLAVASLTACSADSMTAPASSLVSDTVAKHDTVHADTTVATADTLKIGVNPAPCVTIPKPDSATVSVPKRWSVPADSIGLIPDSLRVRNCVTLPKRPGL